MLAATVTLVLISIHAPLAGCDVVDGIAGKATQISIHAPLAGCDNETVLTRAQADISIHAPLAGCDSSARTGSRGE